MTLRLGILIAAFILLSSVIPASAQATFDFYGGWNSLICSNQTSNWAIQNIAGRWWLCTPKDGSNSASHGLFFQGVGAWALPTNLAGTKYTNASGGFASNADDAASTSMTFVKSWGFNGDGELSNTHSYPWDSSYPSHPKLPSIETYLADNYASVNLFSYASHPIKEMSQATGQYGPDGGYLGHGLEDFFDPQYSVYETSFYANQISNFIGSAYAIGAMGNDTDFVTGVGAGNAFDTTPAGHNDGHIGIAVLFASPVRVFNEGLRTYANTKLVYSDTTFYMKAQANNTVGCSNSNSCSLRDYLHDKYGTIGSLNTAWGSNYTSFDSAGTTRSTITVCSGATWNGTNKTCADTLANVNVSPFSLSITVDSVLQGGDCPWLDSSCTVAGINKGFLDGASGTTLDKANTLINYVTGAITVAFLVAPSAGSHTITVSYVQNGWLYGTGLMDENGRNTSWTGTNSICLISPAGSSPGQRSYACRVGNPAGNSTTINANQNLAADLNTWSGEYAAQALKTVRTAFKAAAPTKFFMGWDTTGTWDAPANQEILTAAGQYDDILFTLWYGNQPDVPTAQIKWNYLTQYFGDHPIFLFSTLEASPDSDTASCSQPCGGAFQQSTQTLRATQFNAEVSNCLNFTGFNGDHQCAGIVWWGSHDFGPSNPDPQIAGGEFNNWGLLTYKDNPYDGVSTSTSAVSCPAPMASYSCGGESSATWSPASPPGGNAIGGSMGVKATLALWYATPPVVPAPAPQMMVMK